VIAVASPYEDALERVGLTADGVNVVWQPHPGFQERVLQACEDDALIGGAAGPGKSDCLFWGGMHQSMFPDARMLLLRSTFPELRELMDRAHKYLRPLGWTWHATEKRWTSPAGASLFFGYCDSYADAQQYWGQEFTRIAFDEIGKLADERAWDFVLSRLRTTNKALVPLLESRCSANPGGPGHGWLKKRYITPTKNGRIVYKRKFEDGTYKTIAFYPGRLSDNPSLGEEYRRQLEAMPERLRRQLLDGDWDVGEGLALDELDERTHFIKPFRIPAGWTRYAGFDWGFRHPWVFIALAVSGDGELFVTDALRGRKQYPHEIAETIAEAVDVSRFSMIAAGLDSFYKDMARGDGTKTIAEVFGTYGITLAPANTARVQGLNELRRLVMVRENEPPVLRFFDTPRVRSVLWDCLTSLPVDPKRMEDALKVDANPDTGEGGDDAYDALRYAVNTRMALGEAVPVSPDFSAFSAEALRLETERTRRLRDEHVKVVHGGIDGRSVSNLWEVL
jgi:hypothetical protein